jgi:tRNA A-37 threonylcarbamoyl transferase component Bud32
MTKNSQLSTFIIWESGFPHLSKVLFEIGNEFDIKHVEKIVWPENETHLYLTKLYPNRDFEPDSYKVKEIGGNELIVVLALDSNPQIRDGVNQNTHSYKNKHRIEGLNYLHASDDEKEALFNFSALTDKDEHDFLSFKNSKGKTYVVKKDSDEIEIESIEFKEFSSIHDVFDRLNKYEKWLILRNWEGLPTSVTSNEHEDVDILVEDYYRACTLLNADPFFNESHRVHNLVKVGKGFVPFDIRFKGDHYYDEKWQESMINARIKKDDFYHLTKTDYFWSLLYHGVFHKRKIGKDYIDRLEKLGEKIKGFSKNKVKNLGEAEKYLKKYLSKNGIKIHKPQDKSVSVFKNKASYVGFRIVSAIKFIGKFIARKRTIDLETTLPKSFYKKINSKRAKIIKKNVFETDELIIKTVDKRQKFLIENEMRLLKYLDKYDYFPKVMHYFEGEKRTYLALSKIKGKDLFNSYRIAPSNKNKIIENLNKILDVFKKENVTHRDIRPQNIIINGEEVGVIDFQFALIDQQPLNPKTDKEKYMLMSCEKNLGSQWRDRSASLDDLDERALENILANYDGRNSIIKTPKAYINYRFRKLMRFVSYK